MDHRSDVREFLSTRRDRLTPEQAGLPLFGGNRRVPGLRREEVALLAGVSVDYYTRLERGDLSGASDTVLGAVARALQLDEAETAHLFDLARTASASPTARKPRTRAETVRPGIQRVLDAITDAPAMIRNNAFDYVGVNRLGRALYAPLMAEARPNSARFAFLNPAAREFYQDWEKNTRDLVAAMRGEAGRDPYDRRLTDLVGIRTIDADVRDRVVGSVRRIAEAESTASGMTAPPTVTVNMSAPATVNSPGHTEMLRDRFRAEWGAAIIDYGTVSGSEDVGYLASAADAPLVFWIIGGSDPATVAAAQAAGRFEQDVPSNHSPFFAPVLHPTIERGTEALVLAARTFLAAS